MSRKTVFLLLFAAGIGWLIAAAVRRAVRAPTGEGPMGWGRAPTGAGPLGFGRIFEDCPKCGRQFVLSPGKAARCDSCGEHLAACEWCGKTIEGQDVTAHGPGTAWLCKKHRDEADWESDRLREFGTREALTPPPDTPRAVGARRHYESRIRDVFTEKKHPGDELFPFEKRTHVDSNPEAAQRYPRGVADAYRFYERAIMRRDHGTVGVFPWDFDGSPLYLVLCGTDGSDGFLELYDGDGSTLGYARTGSFCPVWTSRGVVRRRAFKGDRDEVDRQLVDAEKRLGGAGP
jgi:hypothetical protein